MRAAIVLALLSTVLCAAAFDGDSNVEVLDELRMVEVTETGGCGTEVKQAKIKCNEDLMYYKGMVNSQCGAKALKAVQDRIARNLAKMRGLTEKLGGAKRNLRHLQYEEGRIKNRAAVAKEKVLKAMIHQYHQKQALMGDEKKVKAELKDENSTRSRANRATHHAEKLARKEGNMNTVNAAANTAKKLWSTMVQEKVNMGHQYYLLNKDKKMKKVTDKEINRLFTIAKKERANEEKELKKIKDQTAKVAKDNEKLAGSEKKVAKEEEKVAQKEKADFHKQMAAASKLFTKDMSDVEKAQVVVNHFKKALDQAKGEATRLKSKNLKGQLNEAKALLKPVKESMRL